MCNTYCFPARAGHWTDAGLDTPHDRLRPMGLMANDGGVTEGWILSTLSAPSVIVTDPAQLWASVERLAGCAYAPLAG